MRLVIIVPVSVSGKIVGSLMLQPLQHVFMLLKVFCGDGKN